MSEARAFTNWRKSSRSSGGGNCVEVAFASDGAVGVRDSRDPTGPILIFSSSEWTAFVDEVCDGDLRPVERASR